MSVPPARSPGSLALAYFLPYALYVSLGALGDPRTHAEWLYGARALAVGGALAFFRRSYLPLRGPRPVGGSLAVGAAAGLVGAALWVALRAPFGGGNTAPWSDADWLARTLGSTLLPPLVEEILFRGWLLRSLLLFERARAAGSPAPLGDALDRSDLADVAPGAWTPLAVGVSSLAFAVGHSPGEWLAALAYGALMCALWISRRDLVSCISAHAVTNAALACWVRASGDWGSW
jgi:membrane protease YdiL (CAAX protease family)